MKTKIRLPEFWGLYLPIIFVLGFFVLIAVTTSPLNQAGTWRGQYQYEQGVAEKSGVVLVGQKLECPETEQIFDEKGTVAAPFFAYFHYFTGSLVPGSCHLEPRP